MSNGLIYVLMHFFKKTKCIRHYVEMPRMSVQCYSYSCKGSAIKDVHKKELLWITSTYFSALSHLALPLPTLLQTSIIKRGTKA